MTTALFDINADGTDQGFQAANSQVLTLRLRQQPPIGVNTVVWQVFDPAGFNPLVGIAANPPRQSKGATTLSIVGATTGQAVSPVSVDGSVTITMPGAGSHSWIVRCIVNGGLRTLANGTQVVDPTLIVERGIWIPTVLGARKVVCTEVRQFEDDGWAGALAQLPDLVVGDHTVTYLKLPSALAAPSVIGATVNGTVTEVPLSTLAAALPTNSVALAKLAAAAAAPSVVGAAVNGSVSEMNMTTLGAALAAKVQGLLLRAPQILTAGTSINHPTGTRIIFIRGVGGGGAGGGNPASTYTGGGNGGSGTYGERAITVASLTSTYVVGPAGAGVSGGDGGDGGSSTFTHNAVTTTLPGGKGGNASATAVGSAVTVAGGSLASAATNADLSIRGQPGGAYYRDANATPLRFQISPGGSNPLGSGAPAAIKIDNTIQSGNVSSGFGAGGGGTLHGNSASAGTGAAGGPGVWVVEEYA